MHDLGSLGGFSYANAVNSTGTVVGTSYSTAAGDHPRLPLRWLPSTTSPPPPPAPDLLPPASLTTAASPVKSPPAVAPGTHAFLPPERLNLQDLNSTHPGLGQRRRQGSLPPPRRLLLGRRRYWHLFVTTRRHHPTPILPASQALIHPFRSDGPKNFAVYDSLNGTFLQRLTQVPPAWHSAFQQFQRRLINGRCRQRRSPLPQRNSPALDLALPAGPVPSKPPPQLSRSIPPPTAPAFFTGSTLFTLNPSHPQRPPPPQTHPPIPQHPTPPSSPPSLRTRHPSSSSPSPTRSLLLSAREPTSIPTPFSRFVASPVAAASVPIHKSSRADSPYSPTLPPHVGLPTSPFKNS